MSRVKAEEAVERIFEDLRDRRFLKWLFSAYPTLIGNLEGEELRSLDDDIQDEIREAWVEIIQSSFESPSNPKRKGNEI